MRSRLALLALSLPLAACPPEDPDPFVDETGYLDAEQVTYTAEAPLTEARVVTVFGLPGAYEPGGTLAIEGPSGAATVEGPDSTGAFRAEISAAAGDTLTFTYEPADGDPGTDSFTLDDTLEELAPPSGGSSALVTNNSDGTVTVDFSLVATGGVPPFVAFKRLEGLPVISEAGEAVTLEAEVGDEVCAFDLEPDEGMQSVYACEVVF